MQDPVMTTVFSIKKIVCLTMLGLPLVGDLSGGIDLTDGGVQMGDVIFSESAALGVLGIGFVGIASVFRHDPNWRIHHKGDARH
jgi:hypothetical protein